MDNSILILALTLLFSAFFSGMEIGFISSNRLKVELDRSKGTINGRILGFFYSGESRFIAMLLLGNNAVLVIFGIFAAILLNPILSNWGIQGEVLILLIQTLFSTILVLIVAEFIPKALVQINPNNFLKYAALPMFLIYWILYIPTEIILFLSNVILKLLGQVDESTEKVFSKIDLEHYVQDLNDRIKEEQDFGNEMQILQNALDFSSLKARDCMIPRTEIVSLEITENVADLQKLFVDTGLSKILIFRDSIDNIIGYVHSFEMFKKPTSIAQILLPIAFVPSAIPGKELLELFTKQSGNIAVVVDEYGGTAGMITIEDVIEEIFGEIEDEHDTEDWIEEVISPKEWIFSARADIDYINDTYHVRLPEHEEYDTLGGLIIYHLESIPEKGASLELDDFTFAIEEVSDRRIEMVRITKK
ncbi:MAG: hemolysin family protein [Bacteroidetes bacterium]|nr:hemolysin family protein [Bacteroidota bacterium]